MGENIFLDAVANINGESSTTITGVTRYSTKTKIIESVILHMCKLINTKGFMAGNYVLMTSNNDFKSMVGNDTAITPGLRKWLDTVSVSLPMFANKLLNDGAIDSYVLTAGGDYTKFSMLRKADGSDEFGIIVAPYDTRYNTIYINPFGYEEDSLSLNDMLSDRLYTVCSSQRLNFPNHILEFKILTDCFNVDVMELADVLRKKYYVDLVKLELIQEEKTRYGTIYDNYFDAEHRELCSFEQGMERMINFGKYLMDGAYFKWECAIKDFNLCTGDKQ